MLIYVNGTWAEEEQAAIPFMDQGFMYGDSLFETIRVNHGQLFRVKKHLERMRSGMEIIRLDAGQMLADIPTTLETFIEKNGVDSALIRVMVTRGVSHGAPWSSLSKPALYVSARAIGEVPPGPVLVIFVEEKNYPLLRFYPAIKSGNYLGNMLAKKDAEAAGAFEPVFVNQDGYVTECAIRNIFFIKNDVVLTPSVELGVLPGVMRDTIMELARRRGLHVKEARIREDEVHTMDEAFISSTGIGVLPVTWDGFESRYKHTNVLRQDLKQLFESGDL